MLYAFSAASIMLKAALGMCTGYFPCYAHVSEAKQGAGNRWQCSRADAAGETIQNF